MTRTVATFYQFVSLLDCEAKKAEIKALCQQLNLKGTVLLAEEGVNGTIAGFQADIEQFFGQLSSDHRFCNLAIKFSSVEFCPFERLKVKIKSEIVTFGQPQANPTEKVGIHVSPQEWNNLIQDPDLVVIDTRNNYEFAIGSFKGAKNPKTRTFREFPAYVQQNLDPQREKKIAMFCTGGIRCEKASSYLLNQGFEQVYQLEGGILKYLAEIDQQESLWEGECFVFDERVSVTEKTAVGHYKLCLGCGYPLSPQETQLPQYEEGICCHHCYAELTPQKRQRQVEKFKQHLRQQSANNRLIS